jgi:LysM domain
MVRSGETLVSIAQSVWGDASLWYKLAEANGLARSDSVSAGQSLIIPSALSISHNNAATFKPYDAGKALGDIQPGAPKPPTGKKGCGVVGQILLVAIAVAVTALTQGAAASIAGSFLGSALAGAAGSVASQIVGVATGLQDKFSFKQVAMAAIAGGVSGGVSAVSGAATAAQATAAAGKAVTGFGKLFMAGNALNGLGKAAVFLAKGTLAANVARGALVSAATQGTLVATGLQEKFSWSGVAAAGITAGVTGSIHISGGGSRAAARFGAAAAGMAGTIAGAGTRSLLEGTDFGDNLIAVLPDAIGATLANVAIDAVAERGRGRGGMGGRDGDEAGGGIGGGSAADLIRALKGSNASGFSGNFTKDAALDPAYWGRDAGGAASGDAGCDAPASQGRAPSKVDGVISPGEELGNTGIRVAKPGEKATPLPEFLEGLSDRPQKAAVIQAFINQSDGTQSGRPKVANFADTLTTAFGADTHGLLSLADDLANLGALNDGSGRPIAPDAVPLGDALYARTSTVDHGMHYLMRFGESVGTTFEREFIQTFVRDVVQPLERIPAEIMGIPKGVRQNGIGWLLNDLPPIISNEPKLAAAGASGLAKVLERFLPAATKGGGVGKTVLGNYPEYKQLADTIGARHFNIPEAAWDKMSVAEQWAANQKFLDRMVTRVDDIIILATPLDKVRPGSYFARELEYLAGKGYRPSADGTKLIGP